MNRATANLLLLLAGATWGMGFVAQSTAMDRVGPWTYTAAKFVLAALVVLPLALAERRRGPAIEGRGVGAFALVGVFLFLGAILQQIGIVTTSVTNAGFFTGLYVVLTPILALALFRTRPHWVVWPSAFTAFAGIVLVGGGAVGALNRGDLWVILSALFWALQIIAVGRVVGDGDRPFALSFVQFAVAGAAALLGALLLEPVTLASLRAAAPEILYGGILSTGFAFTLQVVAQRRTTAPQAAIFLSSEALFAALFGALFLAERIPAVGFLGCALIFAAMLAVELVPLYSSRMGGEGR